MVWKHASGCGPSLRTHAGWRLPIGQKRQFATHRLHVGCSIQSQEAAQIPGRVFLQLLRTLDPRQGALRFRRKTRGKRFGGMGSDVPNSELAIGESLDNG
jgi:hypothetical protein